MRKTEVRPIVVVYGDEPFERSRRVERVLDELLPAGVDRALALCAYDGARRAEEGGPTFAAVADDLRTPPFLVGRRVVLVREADAFVSAAREPLERYLAAPAPGSALVLECRSFPRTTRLYKAAARVGGVFHECRRLSPRDAAEFAIDAARRLGKRLDARAAARLAERIGPQAGMLTNEVEKLSLFVGERPGITCEDVDELVGLSREEKVFAAADAALLGRTSDALRLWQQVLETDAAAPYKALGGLAFVVRRLLAAHRMVADGVPLSAVAARVMMYRREPDLERQLARCAPRRLTRLLAAMAELDQRVKLGLRSYEHGVEALLIEMGRSAA